MNILELKNTIIEINNSIVKKKEFNSDLTAMWTCISKRRLVNWK